MTHILIPRTPSMNLLRRVKWAARNGAAQAQQKGPA